MTKALAKFEHARRELAEARTLKDVKKIRDAAEAVKTYVKAARAGRESQLYAAEISLLASHKAGGILKELPRAKPKAKGGRVRDSEYERTLKELEVPYRTAQHWQKLARIPEDRVKRYIDWVRKTETAEITVAGLLRTAGHKNIDKPLKLADLFVAPPFSVLDPNQDYWKKRKLEWTSIFDPVLCECMIRWFAPTKEKGYGHILDPFSSGSTRGVVAAHLGYRYTGVEWDSTVEANNRQARAVNIVRPFSAMPKWIAKTESFPDGETYDFIFTSPPRYDNSRWSSYQEFLGWCDLIFRKAVGHLKQNRFVVVAAEEITDEEGVIRGFTDHLIGSLESLGVVYYNRMEVMTAPKLPPWTLAPHSCLRILCFFNGKTTSIPDELGVLDKEEVGPL